MSKNLLKVHKDLEKKKQVDLMARGNKFLDEYKELCRKYKMDLCAELEAKPDGIRPVLRVRPLTEQTELKPWSEAKRENLEKRSACEHENVVGKELPDEDVQKTQCMACSLKVSNWAVVVRTPQEDGLTVRMAGKGVTEEYRKRTEAQIAIIAEEEKEQKEEAGEADDEQTTEGSDAEEQKAE